MQPSYAGSPAAGLVAALRGTGEPRPGAPDPAEDQATGGGDRVDTTGSDQVADVIAAVRATLPEPPGIPHVEPSGYPNRVRVVGEDPALVAAAHSANAAAGLPKEVDPPVGAAEPVTRPTGTVYVHGTASPELRAAVDGINASAAVGAGTGGDGADTQAGDPAVVGQRKLLEDNRLAGEQAAASGNGAGTPGADYSASPASAEPIPAVTVPASAAAPEPPSDPFFSPAPSHYDKPISPEEPWKVLLDQYGGREGAETRLEELRRRREKRRDAAALAEHERLEALRALRRDAGTSATVVGADPASGTRDEAALAVEAADQRTAFDPEEAIARAARKDGGTVAMEALGADLLARERRRAGVDLTHDSVKFVRSQRRKKRTARVVAPVLALATGAAIVGAALWYRATHRGDRPSAGAGQGDHAGQPGSLGNQGADQGNNNQGGDQGRDKGGDQKQPLTREQNIDIVMGAARAVQSGDTHWGVAQKAIDASGRTPTNAATNILKILSEAATNPKATDYDHLRLGEKGYRPPTTELAKHVADILAHPPAANATPAQKRLYEIFQQLNGAKSSDVAVQHEFKGVIDEAFGLLAGEIGDHVSLQAFVQQYRLDATLAAQSQQTGARRIFNH